MPHILALYYSKKKTILTCYEFLESHWTRKLSMLAFSTVNQVIWPSEYERASYLKFYPYMKSKSIVRPIFSNIPKAPSQPKLDYIAYFGLFKPGKGLDKFFELADVIKQKGLNYKLLAIGGVLDIYEGYYQKLHARYKDAAIEWYINKTPDEVAMLLAKAKYCYLPFDDGASERRGSLLAALLNGCVVFCKHGAYTPDDMKRVVKNAIEPEQVIAEIYKIEVNGSFENLSEQAEVYAKKFDIHSVVEQNIKLYQTILSEK
jgi:glycosyltransferase involved in cell wall biosynthesis